MEIRKAKISDMGEIERIYSAAREYMRANGNPTQWGDSYPPKEKITYDIENGNLYLVVEDEIPHGVFAYIEWEDPTYKEIYFGEWKNSLPYAVMHRMASDGKIHGIGRAALDFCKSKCGNLKADTHKDNKAMQNLLMKNGFLYCGIIHTENGSERLAYQYTYFS